MRTWSSLALAALLAMMVAGCGGGGGTPLVAPPPVASVRTLLGGTPTNAAWVAFQDGDGAWQVLSPAAAGAYSAAVSDADGRFGFAIAAPDGSLQPVITIYQTTLREMRSFTHVFSPFTPGPYALSGDVAGVTPGEDAVTVALGYNVAMPQALAPYTLAALPGGTYDLLACRRKLSPGSIDKFFLRRDLALNNHATQTIDFTSASYAVTPAGYTLTVPDMTTGAVMLQTRRGTLLTVSDPPDGTGTTMHYAALAAPVAGDLYLADVSATHVNGVLATRQIRKAAFATPRTLALTLPALFGSPAVSTAAGRITTRWSPYPGALAYHLQFSPAAGNQWSAWVSAGWLHENTDTGYTLPNLASLPGWQLNWAPAGCEQYWTADAVTGNRPLDAVAAALATGTYADGLDIGVTGMGMARE